MSFTLKYSISEDTIRCLELISKTDGYLQVLRMNPSWAGLLEKEAGIKEAISSIGVEGTIISIDQAKAITTGDRSVEIDEHIEREFVGYYESLQFVKENITNDLTTSLLLKIHSMVTRGQKDAYPGEIRSKQNAIKSRGKIIYTPPPCEQLNFLLKEFLNWFNSTAIDKQKSPIIAAAICHFWFVWIHPFSDGNGRVARLLTAFLLLKKKTEGIKYFALSDYYNVNKDSYYDVLENTNKCNPISPAMNFNSDMSNWISFFVKSYLEQTEHIKIVGNRILQYNIRIERLRREGSITSGHEKILSFLAARERTSYKELIKYLGVTKQRVYQILQSLRDAHILIEDEFGKEKWFSLGSPEEEMDEAVLKKKLYRKSVDKSIGVRKKGVINQGVLPIFNI